MFSKFTNVPSFILQLCFCFQAFSTSKNQQTLRSFLHG